MDFRAIGKTTKLAKAARFLGESEIAERLEEFAAVALLYQT
jgi:hypothetical protein